MKRNTYGYPAPHCIILPPEPAQDQTRLTDFIHGWSAGWLCWGPTLAVCLAVAWGWL